MESRFRRFLQSRREKTKVPSSTADPSDYSERSASPQRPLPSSSSQISSRPTTGQRSIFREYGLPLQAVPYEAHVAGKAPRFSAEPVKGNGPVKLQTRQRLSSGELVDATPDKQRILDDIKEGEYIVGRKEARLSRQHTLKVATSQNFPDTARSPPPSQALFSSKALSTTPLSIQSSPDESMHSSEHRSSQGTTDNLSTPSSVVSSAHPQSNHWVPETLETNLDSGSSRMSVATSPSMRQKEEPNATIAALWKAEYNRLVDMYGRDKVDRNMTHIADPNSPTAFHRTASPKSCGRLSEVSLEPLPRPHADRTQYAMRRSSNLSAASNSGHDDKSDSSSDKRASLVSSYAGSSSWTIQTSATEHDAVVTREDIRKIVDQMRSTYLRALDANTAPTKLSQPTKKRRRAKRSAPVVNSSTAMIDRQTWHGKAPPPPERPVKRSQKTRSTPHPIPGFGRLSPVEASPPQSRTRPTERLQRADSTTLGSIMANIKTENESSKASPIVLCKERMDSADLGHDDIDSAEIPRGMSPTIPTFPLPPSGNFF